MTEESGSLDSLVMGGNSEQKEVSSEEARAKASTTAKKIKQIQKDEGTAHEFDEDLAKMLSDLSLDLIIFIAFLVDNGVPSLTILAFISLIKEKAWKICENNFSDDLKTHKHDNDLKKVGFSNKQTEMAIDSWWSFIFLANNDSKTVQLFELNKDKKFIENISKGLSDILKTFLSDHKEENYKVKILEKIVNHRGKLILTKN